jgi:hypothetical protein
MGHPLAQPRGLSQSQRRLTPVRRPLVILAALVLATVVATPANAATLHRTFRASVGTNGSSGTTAIAAYTDGTGRVTYDLRNLRKGATYRVEVRKGRCANLGTVVTRLSEVKASSTGRVGTTRSVSVTKTNAIWSANWKNRLAVRFVSGSSIRCGNLNFTVATRVKMPNQDVLGRGIDLAVVRSPNGYPYCNVAMYLPSLNQPTEPGVTFLFAHARKGMFLPLLNEWLKHRGDRMIGLRVYVYTSNNMKHTYQIEKVWKSKTMNGVFKTNEKLWLQTSTGPNFTYPKLFLQAKRLSSSSVSAAEAKPDYRIVKCG